MKVIEVINLLTTALNNQPNKFNISDEKALHYLCVIKNSCELFKLNPIDQFPVGGLVKYYEQIKKTNNKFSFINCKLINEFYKIAKIFNANININKIISEKFTVKIKSGSFATIEVKNGIMYIDDINFNFNDDEYQKVKQKVINQKYLLNIETKKYKLRIKNAYKYFHKIKFIKPKNLSKTWNTATPKQAKANIEALIKYANEHPDKPKLKCKECENTNYILCKQCKIKICSNCVLK